MKHLLLLVLFLVGPGHAAVYTWVDAHGVKHFGDKPPSTQQGVRTIEVPLIETVKTRQVPHQGTTNNNGRKPASGPASRKVVMYSAEWCGVCRRAKNYFKKHRVPFSEKDIDKSALARREFVELKGRGVPLILVGKRRLSGFSPASFERIYRR